MKYRGYSRPDEPTLRDLRRIHPVWRGVGFAFIILIPIMSYAAMQVFLQLNDRNGWIPLPADIMAKPGEFLYNYFPDPLLYIKLAIFIVFLFLFFTIFQLVSFFITGLAGVSPKQDPFYVPPVRHTKKAPRRYK